MPSLRLLLDVGAPRTPKACAEQSEARRLAYDNDALGDERSPEQATINCHRCRLLDWAGCLAPTVSSIHLARHPAACLTVALSCRQPSIHGYCLRLA